MPHWILSHRDVCRAFGNDLDWPHLQQFIKFRLNTKQLLAEHTPLLRLYMWWWSKDFSPVTNLVKHLWYRDCRGPANDDSPFLSVLLHLYVWDHPCGWCGELPNWGLFHTILSKIMRVSSTVTLDIVCTVAVAHSVARCWGLTLSVQRPCRCWSSIPSWTQ
jgi:hypothetical protein